MSSRVKLTHEEKVRITAQAEAEAAFSCALEARGVDCERLRRELKLTRHTFNSVAHYLYGVADEDPPPMLMALLEIAKSPPPWRGSRAIEEAEVASASLSPSSERPG
jgi:hypothetical protein